MSHDRFYCSTCCCDRPLAGSKVYKVRRGAGSATIRRCAMCVERRKGTAAERDARSRQEVKEKRETAVYVRYTSGKVNE